MNADDPDRDALVDEWRRAHSALGETITLVEAGWERASRVRAGDPEPWSPRAAAEHAIAADRGFMTMIARALDLGMPPRSAPECATPADALAALAAATAEGERVLSAVTDEALAIEVEFAGHVGTLIHFAAGHLREHARQVARLR